MQNDDREWYDMQRRFTSSEFIYMAAIPASVFSAVLPVDLSAWDDFRFPSRMGDCQAVASGAAFQGLAKVEVELGRVICAPRRWRPRSGKANRRTRLRSSSRRYRFCPSRSISLPGSFPTRDRRRRSGLAKAARGLPQWGSAWRVGPGRPRRDACASTCLDGDYRGARATSNRVRRFSAIERCFRKTID
ncbi:MAG: hypothetical protein OXD29_11325 [Roseovarius sp.]|nr:hypothetical protein [Roseovarius sp.]